MSEHLILGMVEGMLSELAKAKTGDAFRQAFENLADFLGSEGNS